MVASFAREATTVIFPADITDTNKHTVSADLPVVTHDAEEATLTAVATIRTHLAVLQDDRQTGAEAAARAVQEARNTGNLGGTAVSVRITARGA